MPRRPTEKVLNVYNWSDYIQPAGDRGDFEKEYGIHVNYDVFDSNEILETKLLTGHTNYDVVVPSAPSSSGRSRRTSTRSSTSPCCRTSRTSIPNVARATAVYDPGNQHSVDYMWITSGRGLQRRSRSARACPDAPVDSWRMLFDPAVISKFQDCGVSILDAPVRGRRHGADLARQQSEQRLPGGSQGGREGTDGHSALRALRGFLALHRQSRQRRHLPGDGLVGGRQAGARPRQGGGQGRRPRLRDPARRARSSNYDVLAIPADAPHVRNAHLFINYLLRPEIAARNFQPHQVRQQRISVAAAARCRRCATIRASIRRRRCAHGWCPSAPRPAAVSAVC